MSLVFNMVGGGGGISENRAVLVVRVPAGSTVTATKGGVTLTPKMWVVEADPTQDIALFVIAPSLFDSVNPWTVTATLGADTASDTVIINDNKEYDLELSFRVPAGYQEVEWIETTGTQYIDTGVIPSNNHRLTIRIQVSQTAQTKAVFGQGMRYWGLTAYNSKWTVCDNGSFYDGNGTYSPVVGTDYDIVFNNGSGGIIVNDVNIRNGNVFSVSGSHSLLISARPNSAGTGIDIYGMFRYKYAKLELISTGEAEFEYYPCYQKADSVAGMWDRVSKTFITNSGTGTFVVGPDVN